jgi:rRNA maturation protein Nop10
MSDGAIYSPMHSAAKCPQCGEWAKRTHALPWDEDRGMRLRYHKCPVCSYTFKSIQEDATFPVGKQSGV